MLLLPLQPLVHGHILILLVLLVLDIDLRPYLLPPSQLIHLQATLNGIFVMDLLPSVGLQHLLIQIGYLYA
jgi:hypothetical protein